MKKSFCLAVGLLAFNLTPAFGQPAATPPIPNFPAQAAPPGVNFQQRLQRIVERSNPPGDQSPALTKFNLDFPGGTPAELVKAIEKAMGKPLNAIIPTEDADIQLPPLKMNDVVTPQLFAALQAASRKTVVVQGNQPFGNSYSQQTTDYGFTTADNPVSDSSIWYFHVENPGLPPVVSTAKICRFYSLAPYLDRGFTVDDITTAIQTGWKMAGVIPPPELNYHKETKLLIAFGEPNELQTIQDVLYTLPATNVTRNEADALRQRINEIAEIENDVASLKYQVNQLTKKVSASTSNSSAASEKNSGK